MITTIRQKTIADLHGMPDDGRIYELIHGEIVVGPHRENRISGS